MTRNRRLEKDKKQYGFDLDHLKIFPNFIEIFASGWLNRREDSRFKDLTNSQRYELFDAYACYGFTGEVLEFSEKKLEDIFYSDLKGNIDESVAYQRELSITRKRTSRIKDINAKLTKHGVKVQNDTGKELIADAIVEGRYSLDLLDEDLSLGQGFNQICADLLREEAEKQSGSTREATLRRAKKYDIAADQNQKPKTKPKKARSAAEKEDAAKQKSANTDILNSEASKKFDDRMEPVKTKLKLIIKSHPSAAEMDKNTLEAKLNECCNELIEAKDDQIQGAVKNIENKAKAPCNQDKDIFEIITEEVQNVIFEIVTKSTKW